MNYRNFNSEYLNLTGVVASQGNGNVSSFKLLYDLSEDSGELFTTDEVGNKIAELTINGVNFSLWYKFKSATATIGLALLSDNSITPEQYSFFTTRLNGVANLGFTNLNAFQTLGKSNNGTNYVNNYSGDNFYLNQNTIRQLTYTGFNTVNATPTDATEGRLATAINPTKPEAKRALAETELFFNPNSGRVPASFYDSVQVSEPVVNNTEETATDTSGDNTRGSSFDIVSGQFAQYLDLVDRVAQKLVEVKGDLDTAKALCKDGSGNQAACQTVEELEAYVQGLEQRLTTLTTENTALKTFKKNIADKLDGVTEASTNADIVAALQTKLTAATTTIAGKDVEIQNLTSAKETAEGTVTSLETKINEIISNRKLTGEEDDTLIDALNDIDAEVQRARQAASSTNRDLSSIKTDLQSQDVELGLDTFYEEITDAAIAKGENLTDAEQAQIYVDALQARVGAVNDSLKQENDKLIEDGVITEAEAVEAEDLAAEWSAALIDLAATELSLETASREKITAVSEKQTLQAQVDNLTDVNAEQAANLLRLESELEGASSELEQYDTLSGTLTTAINSLEATLEGAGITLEEETSSFSGGGLSNVFGGEPNDLQKLLFRGIDARKAYLNMSGQKAKSTSRFDENSDVSNFMGSSSKGNNILGLGIIAGLVYVASKYLKK